MKGAESLVIAGALGVGVYLLLRPARASPASIAAPASAASAAVLGGPDAVAPIYTPGGTPSQGDPTAASPAMGYAQPHPFSVAAPAEVRARIIHDAKREQRQTSALKVVDFVASVNPLYAVTSVAGRARGAPTTPPAEMARLRAQGVKPPGSSTPPNPFKSIFKRFF